MTIKKPPAPTFFKGYSFGGSYWVGCLPRNPFEEEKGFTLHCMEMSCEKPSQVAIRIFDKFSLRHRATVKALGSLESGFSLPLSLNSRMGEDSPALEPSSSPNPHLPMLGLGCWARGFFRKGTSVGSWTIFPCSPWLLLLFNSRLLISNSYISERSDRLTALEREIGTIHTSAGDPWASPWGKWWWHHPPSDIPVREWISLKKGSPRGGGCPPPLLGTPKPPLSQAASPFS